MYWRNSYAIMKGLEIWESERAKWVGQKLNEGKKSTSQVRAIDIDVDEIIDHILTNRWRTPAVAGEENSSSGFPRSVPLTQMVDILVDLWEAEGLDS